MSIEVADTWRLSRSTMRVRVIKVISPSLFWIHLTHCDKQLKDMLNNLTIYMNQRKDDLIVFPHAIKEGLEVAAYTKMGWQRAIVTRLNEDDTVQLMLRDFGIHTRHLKKELYVLTKQFKESWYAIPCGLAYAEPTTSGQWWSRKTQALMKILAQGHEGQFKILASIRGEGAWVSLQVITNQTSFDLLDTLIQLGRAKKILTPATVALPRFI